MPQYKAYGQCRVLSQAETYLMAEIEKLEQETQLILESFTQLTPVVTEKSHADLYDAISDDPNLSHSFFRFHDSIVDGVRASHALRADGRVSQDFLHTPFVATVPSNDSINFPEGSSLVSALDTSLDTFQSATVSLQSLDGKQVIVWRESGIAYAVHLNGRNYNVLQEKVVPNGIMIAVTDS